MSNEPHDQDHRPSPEALLAAIEQEQRGRLKIFLGAAPGVGKTYAMLEAAQVRKREGVNLVVGVVETHGRPETEVLLQGLEIIPRRTLEYRKKTFEAMDLDAILARRPQLVLVDELAHTNIPGSRHPKRYLDVEELLAAGIDVYTTVNIQHLESLNDAVALITSTRVRETIPDRILDRAAEIELVDLSPEELLQRLREGKVYVPAQAQQTMRHFFNLGNRTALRQLALRRAAERVDEQMQTYMQAHAISGPWLAGERIGEDESLPRLLPSPGLQRPAIYPYLWSAGAVCVAAGVAKILGVFLSLPDLSLVFLTAVLFSAVTWGLKPSIIASFLSVLAYNFFFVHPVYTLTVANPQDFLTLLVYLIVAVLTSNLAARLRDQADAARRREASTAALYALSRQIAGAAGLDEVLQAVGTSVAQILRVRVAVLLPEAGQLVCKAGYPSDTCMYLTEAERAAATWAWQHNQPAGRGSDTLPGAEWFYLPLRTAQGTVGILGLQLETPEAVISSDQRYFLEALAGQAAVAIERTRLVREMEQARLLTETERRRDALLSSVSHDLRTPLVSIIGAVTSLLTYGATYDETSRQDLLSTIQEEAERLNRFVGNLLDMMRLESGKLALKREWVEIADVIGTASARLVRQLSQHQLVVEVEPRLPLLWLDFVLVEHVLVNLLENAAKYSPPGTTIRVHVYRHHHAVVVEVADEGVGVPPADLERIFDKFYRVQRGDRQGAGTGLGLSICRGIIEAHGGHIAARSQANGNGTVFTLTFPFAKEPPAIAER